MKNQLQTWINYAQIMMALHINLSFRCRLHHKLHITVYQIRYLADKFIKHVANNRKIWFYFRALQDYLRTNWELFKTCQRNMKKQFTHEMNSICNLCMFYKYSSLAGTYVGIAFFPSIDISTYMCTSFCFYRHKIL